MRIVHCADLHLDSPFHGLTRKTPSLADKFRDAALKSFTRVINLAIEMEVDAVTVGGDTFDGRDRSLHAQWSLYRELKRLANNDIQAFIVAGNHDPLAYWFKDLELPDNVHLFAGDRVTGRPLERGGKVVAEIWGVSYPVAEVTTNLALDFPGGKGGIPRLALLHANVGSHPQHAPYAPATQAELESRGIDAWLLGHIHQPLVIKKGNPLILYPGCVQGRDPGESGPRGCYLVEGGGAGFRVEFHPTQSIRWETVTIDCSPLHSRNQLIDHLVDTGEKLLAEIAPHEDGLAVRWRMQGRSPLHRQLSSYDAAQEIEKILAEEFQERVPFLYTDSVSLELKPEIDIQSLTASPNPAGELVSLVEKARSDPEILGKLSRELDELFTRDPHGRKYLQPLDQAELREILESALYLGLDLLLPEEES